MTGPRIVRIARRAAVMLGGHLLSSVTVAPTVLLLGWIVERRGPTPMDMLDPDVLGVAVVATVLVFLATLLPAGTAIAFAEINGISHWAYYVCAGGLTALLLLALLSLVPRPDDAPMAGTIATLAVGAGLFSGLVYWMVAGRRSGALVEAWRRDA